jgi:plastocyanin
MDCTRHWIWFGLAALVVIALAPGCGDDDGGDDDVVVDANGGGGPDAPVTPDAPPAADAPVGDDGGGAAVVEVDCASVSADEQVEMQNLVFSPAEITITAGQVIEWVNLELPPHTVTSGNRGGGDAGDLFDSGNLANGETYCLRFDEVGAYDYYCAIHPGMDGLVTVN